MFRFYTSTIVLICIVAQVLPGVPEGICRREVRENQQVVKLSYRRCTTKSRFCHPIQLTNCLYYIKYYKCTYVQYLLTTKFQLTYTCCDGYYNKNDKCEKESVGVTPRTTCNTCLCNGTCTNDTESAISDLPVPAEVNKDEDTKNNTRAYNDSSFTNPTATIGVPNPEEGHHTEETVNATFESTCSTCRCNDTCETDTNSVIGRIPVPTKAKHTQGGLKLILIIAIVILAALTLIVQAALWIMQYQSEIISERHTELESSRNTSRDRNEALKEDAAHIYEL